MKKFLIFYCAISILLLFCSTNIEDNPLSKEGFQRHEVVMGGKRISFILPNCYTDTACLKGCIAPHWSGCKEHHVFFSMENDANFFYVVLCKEYGKTVDLIESQKFYGRALDYPCIVYFTEKKKDENGNIYSVSMGSSMYPIAKEEDLALEEQRLIHSYFDFTLYVAEYVEDSSQPNFKIYICALRTRDKIRDFSYEEKKKIIESVRIEDIN